MEELFLPEEVFIFLKSSVFCMFKEGFLLKNDFAETFLEL